MVFTIPGFGIELEYPEDWDQDVEHDQTYLFWDENSGSLRVTPTRIERDGFEAISFLEGEHARQQARSPEWRTFGGRRTLCYVQDGEHDGAIIRNHFYLSGRGNVLLTCSWAYEPALFDTEEAQADLEAGTEDAEVVLESIRFVPPGAS